MLTLFMSERQWGMAYTGSECRWIGASLRVIFHVLKGAYEELLLVRVILGIEDSKGTASST